MRFLISLAMLVSTADAADFTTYVGPGTSNLYNQSTIGAITTDAQGNTYVTGRNAFVTKLDTAGNIVFSTTLGNSEIYSYGYSIALDPSGNIWVGGQTSETNFPLMNALQSAAPGGGIGFLAKLAPDGTVLYSSYFGGVQGNSSVNAIATDQDGNVYATGWTDTLDFPITAGLPASPENPNKPAYGLFVAKLDSAGQKIVYSTMITGIPNCDFCFPVSTAMGTGIAVDGSGNALVSGYTNTALPAIAEATASGAFVFKINAAGNGLVYFTFAGVGGPITTDASGNAYVTGYAYSADFPTTPGAFQTTYGGGKDGEAFAMKLNPSGATVWATFLPGHGDPNAVNPAAAVNLDSSGNVWLTATQAPTDGLDATFVAELTSDGSSLPYFVEFPSTDAGQSIAVDPSGVVHFAGPLGLVLTITPVKPPAPRARSVVNAASNQFLGTIAPGEIISIYGAEIGPAVPVGATPVNGAFPTSLGGVQVLAGGVPIPLLYVSDSQINAEIPSPVNGLDHGLADLQVVNDATALPDFHLLVASSVFGAFDRSGEYLAVTNQDGTVNSKTNPAKEGSYISLWATGFGGVSGVVMDGALATAANNYCGSCLATFTSFHFRVTETVQYAGPSPGLIDGLMQINVMIPTAQSPTPQLQVSFSAPGATFPQFLGFVWVTQ